MTNVRAHATAAQWAVVVGFGVHPSEGVNFTLILTFSPQGRRDLSAPLLHTGGRMRGSRLRGNDDKIRVNDACEQCTGRRGDGAMGSCRWVWGYVGGGVRTRCVARGFTLVSWKGRRGRPFHPGFMRDRGLAWSPRLSHHRARTVAWATEPVSARTGPRRTHVY